METKVIEIGRLVNQKGRSVGVEFGGESGRCVKKVGNAVRKCDLRIGDVVEKVFS